MAWKIINTDLLPSGHLYYEVEFDDGTLNDFITDSNRLVGVTPVAPASRMVNGERQFQRKDTGEWVAERNWPRGVAVAVVKGSPLDDAWLKSDIERQVNTYLAKRKKIIPDDRNPAFKGRKARQADVPDVVKVMVTRD